MAKLLLLATIFIFIAGCGTVLPEDVEGLEIK